MKIIEHDLHERATLSLVPVNTLVRADYPPAGKLIGIAMAYEDFGSCNKPGMSPVLELSSGAVRWIPDRTEVTVLEGELTTHIMTEIPDDWKSSGE